MPTVVELRKRCKQLKIKGYSNKKKSELEQLIKKKQQSGDVVLVQQKPVQQKAKPSGEKKMGVIELKKKCREMKIKNCSKMKKAELLKVVGGKQQGEKAQQSKKQQTKDLSFDREKKIKQMKQKVQDDYDPIYMQQFKSWSDDDLRNAILLGSYYYLPKTLLDHVQAKMKQQHVIKDPMSGVIIPTQKIKEIFAANKKQYKKIEKFIFDTANMEIKLEHKFFKLFTNKNAQPYMQVILEYNPNIYKITTKNPYFKKPNQILIGNIPMGISTSPGIGEVKALDASSTSEVILSKILEMLREGKLFSNQKDNKLTLLKINNLPKTNVQMRKWYNTTRIIDTTSKNSKYFELLKELEDF
jgi:hypothetical protein